MYKLTAILTLILVGQVLTDTRIDLTFSARDVQDADLWEPPNPYAVVFYAATESDSYSRMGKTSTIDNTYDPVWTESFTFFAFSGSNRQRVRVEVWDWDFITGDELLGTVEFPLVNVLNAAGNYIEVGLNEGSFMVSGRINATYTRL